MNVSCAERWTHGLWEAMKGDVELEGKLLEILSNVILESGDRWYYVFSIPFSDVWVAYRIFRVKVYWNILQGTSVARRCYEDKGHVSRYIYVDVKYYVLLF